MSRGTEMIGPLQIHFGHDHALGRFIDICDIRYAGTEKDEQGEGYVVEWSDKFGLNPNLIAVTVEELLTGNYDSILWKANLFVANNFTPLSLGDIEA